MKKPPINLQILARAIAKAKGGKPATYLRKMHTLRNGRTGAVMVRHTKSAVPYPHYALRNHKVALLYAQLGGNK